MTKMTDNDPGAAARPGRPAVAARRGGAGPADARRRAAVAEQLAAGARLVVVVDIAPTFAARVVLHREGQPPLTLATLLVETPAGEHITGVSTIREARQWMRNWQAGRRNWSPNEMALQAAQEYAEEKLASGVRTDLRGKPAVDTAEAIGKRYGKTGRWVRDAVDFAEAVERLRDNVGIDFPNELVEQPDPGISRDQVINLSKAPAEVQREALELVKKRNKAGVASVVEKAKRLIEGGGPTKTIEDKAPDASRFDLANLVQQIDKWSEEAVRAYNPVTDVRATMHLQAHLPGALHKLITLAEANGLAGDVLDAYVEGRVQSVSRRWRHPDQPEPAEELGDELEEAAPAGDDDLRRRLSERLADDGSTAMAGVASAIGISKPTLKSFLAGHAIYARTRERIETYLSEGMRDRSG